MDNSPINRFLQMATSCPLLCKTREGGKCCALPAKYLKKTMSEMSDLVEIMGRIFGHIFAPKVTHLTDIPSDNAVPVCIIAE